MPAPYIVYAQRAIASIVGKKRAGHIAQSVPTPTTMKRV